MKIKVFNTGRKYGPEGQVIFYTPIGDDVLFYDYTRQIDGIIRNCVATSCDVLKHYDHDLYDYTSSPAMHELMAFAENYMGYLVKSN